MYVSQGQARTKHKPTKKFENPQQTFNQCRKARFEQIPTFGRKTGSDGAVAERFNEVVSK